tara:strand:- start:11 stop:397 length:387 start_codon:yes stop_codon:yes gene_type:complete
MSKELNRMQKLAGVPAKKVSKSLNEHQIGGIVGIGAINQIPPRDKTDYEMAFEHFMTEEIDPITGTDIDDIDMSPSVPDFGDDEITGTSLEEEDNTIEEVLSITQLSEMTTQELLQLKNKIETALQIR